MKPALKGWTIFYGHFGLASIMQRHSNTDIDSEAIIGLTKATPHSRCRTVATVVGDPISPDRVDYSAIEWVLKRSRWDTLRISHRLPDRLSGLVNEFARYNGLRSSPEIASRRLVLDQSPDLEYRNIIQPDETTTWVDINGHEQPSHHHGQMISKPKHAQGSAII